MNFCEKRISHFMANKVQIHSVSFISPEKVEDVAGTIAKEVGVVIFGV